MFSHVKLIKNFYTCHRLKKKPTPKGRKSADRKTHTHGVGGKRDLKENPGGLWRHKAHHYVVFPSLRLIEKMGGSDIHITSTKIQSSSKSHLTTVLFL